MIRLFWGEASVPLIAASKRLMSDAETALARAYHCEMAADRFVVARALARYGLGQCAGRAPPGIALDIGPDGRPFPAQPELSGWDFSISHSGRVVGCAVRMGGRIGFDLEEMSTSLEVDDLVAFAFSRMERDVVAIAPNDCDRRRRFYAIWTAKEAVLKATGEGLLDDMRRMTVIETDHALTVLRDDLPASVWRIRRPDLGETVMTALVCQNAGEFRAIQVAADELARASTDPDA